MKGRLSLAIAIVAASLAAAAAAGAERAPEGYYARIDTAVRSLPPARSIDEVASRIGAAARSDAEKARGAFTWIAENIDYDVDSFFGRTKPVVDPEGVFRTRKSVCAGYASLYASIAGRMGLEVVTISGRAKGYGESAGAREIPVNHDWNAVRIEGSWRLVDSTWGAGSVDDEGVFSRDFTAFWFDCEPRLFALWHLPEDPAWQLLAEPVTYEAYLAEPKFRYGDYERIFGAGVSFARILAWHRAGKMPDSFAVQDIAGLGFTASAIVAWVDAGRLPDPYEAETLKGYGMPLGEIAAAIDSGGLVECWSFTEVDLKILEAPVRRTIEAGKPVAFVFESEALTEVGLDNNEEWTYMKKTGNRLEALVSLAAGKLSVTIHAPSDGVVDWWVLLQYEVR